MTMPENSFNKNRIVYLDIAKGIGILCVIIGHTFSGFPWYFVNSFHMPLFFMISGFFFHSGEETKIIKKGILRLLKPYFFTCFLFIIYYGITDAVSGEKNMLDWIWGAIYGSGFDYLEPFYIKGVGGIWFLLALFSALIMLNAVLNLPKDIQPIIVLALAYAGYMTYAYFVFPWCLQNAMEALLFCYVGYRLKNTALSADNRRSSGGGVFSLFGNMGLWSKVLWGYNYGQL